MEFIINEGVIIRHDATGDESTRAATGTPPEEGILAREAFWFANGNIPFFGAHMQRLEDLLSSLNQGWPGDLPPVHEIKRLFIRLINKNKAFMGGWVKATFHFSHLRNHYSANVVAHPDRQFPMEQEGRTAVISPFVKFSQNPLARFPLSAEPLRQAEFYRNEASFRGTALFLNEKGALTEAAGAALFGLRKNTLLTPAPSTGCLRILYSDHLLRAASQTGFQIVETDRLTLPALLECEEVFTVSEGEGFRWIAGIGDKRFVRTKTTLIWKQFNRTAFPGPGQ